MSPVDRGIFFAYLAAVLWLGLRSARKGEPRASDGYLLAGRGLTLPAFVATLVTTWYGGILGVGEYSFRYGLSNWLVFGVPYYVAAALFAWLLAGRAREAKALTLPEQVRRCYGPAAGLLASVIVFLEVIPSAYVLELGALFGTAFGIPVPAGMLLAAAFALAYLWRGGYRAVASADRLQFAAMFGGFGLLLGILFVRYGTAPLEALPASHWSWNGGRPVQSIVVWYVIALATLVEPAFYQLSYAAKTPQVARRGLLVSIGCWMVFDAMTTLTGLYARALLTDLPVARATEAFPLLVQRFLPVGVVGLLFVAMAATVMSTVDGYLFISGSVFGRDLATAARRAWRRVTGASGGGAGDQGDSAFEERAIQVGLVASALLAVGFGWLSRSVVGLWHGFGSVTTASLLLPVLGAFLPRLRMTPRGALVHMAVVLPLTAAWLYSRKLVQNGYWLGLEPIYAGMAAGAVVWAVDRALENRRAAALAAQAQGGRISPEKTGARTSPVAGDPVSDPTLAPLDSPSLLGVRRRRSSGLGAYRVESGGRRGQGSCVEGRRGRRAPASGPGNPPRRSLRAPGTNDGSE
jgi:SSS family solute:Na+ symporter